MTATEPSEYKMRSLAHVNLTTEAYNELKRNLMTGGFKPGAKLTIRNLAAGLGISPTPVREALVQLAAEGALTQTAGRSFIVPQLDAAGYEDLRTLRELLEGEAVYRAAERTSPATINTLTALHTQLIYAKENADYASALAYNQQFHLTLCAASGSLRLLRIVEGLWLQMGPLLNALYEHREAPSSPKEHRHITLINALRDGDKDTARRAIQLDISDGATPILAHLQAQTKTPT
ncbi:GntR family transcriptional regulator (plasmid) [Pseudohalocynthiibacter aestuariivivens]|nr:GntR family transcriptional regulator [Pseudohalocynthiibacter aestuariivivens]QIE47763.1 GntR family transcriptional regulator [Pseudohalocynthiibacter aestuariivivens]